MPDQLNFLLYDDDNQFHFQLEYFHSAGPVWPETVEISLFAFRPEKKEQENQREWLSPNKTIRRGQNYELML